MKTRTGTTEEVGLCIGRSIRERLKVKRMLVSELARCYRLSSFNDGAAPADRLGESKPEVQGSS
jgi:hypothetical protein